LAGLDDIRECLTAFLEEQGVRAVSAWPEESRKQSRGGLAAVSLREVQGGPAGFRDYLGERYDEQTKRWVELSGRRVLLTFGVDLYAGPGEGAAEVERTFDRLAQALHTGGPAGLKIKEFSCGECVYDGEADRWRCPVRAVCQAYLYAAADEGGAFLDFEVKGVNRA